MGVHTHEDVIWLSV